MYNLSSSRKYVGNNKVRTKTRQAIVQFMGIVFFFFFVCSNLGVLLGNVWKRVKGKGKVTLHLAFLFFAEVVILLQPNQRTLDICIYSLALSNALLVLCNVAVGKNTAIQGCFKHFLAERRSFGSLIKSFLIKSFAVDKKFDKKKVKLGVIKDLSTYPGQKYPPIQDRRSRISLR